MYKKRGLCISDATVTYRKGGFNIKEEK